MSEEQTNAEKSLCWTCKYGLCLQEVEQQTMVHDALDEMPPAANPFDDPGFEEEHKEPAPHVHHISASRVQAICFWRPATVPNSPPIRVSEVRQCNRYGPKD
jgi:hypothetical protein